MTAPIRLLLTAFAIPALVGVGRDAGAQPVPEPETPATTTEGPAPTEQPTSPAPPAPAPVAAPTAPTPASAPAPAVEAHDGPEIEFTGLVQARYQIVPYEEGNDEPPFVLRRARAQVEVEPMDRLHLTLEAELTDTQPVRDAFVRYRFVKAFEVTAGNFKRPFGSNELDSSWEIVASERGVVSERLRDMSLAGRDLGAMVSGRVKRWLGLRWALGTFNGAGNRAVEDAAGRLSISPGPLTIGGAAVYSRGRPEVSTATSYVEGVREAWAIEGDATVELPFLFARIEATSGTNREVVHTDHFGHFFGLFGTATARLRWSRYVLEPGFKVERYDSSVKYGDDAVVMLTPLVRLWVGEHLRLLVEGNIVMADDLLRESLVPVERRLVVQLGGRT